MKTVTIYPPIEVFPDPDYCEDGKNSTCKQIRGTLEHCAAFIDYTSGEPFPTKLDYDENESKAIKCQPCRDLYQHEKFKENCKTPDHYT